MMKPKAPVRPGHKAPPPQSPAKNAPPSSSPTQPGWQRVWKWADTGSEPMGQPRLGLARLVQ